MENTLYIPVNDQTKVSCMKFCDGTVNVCLNEQNKVYHIYNTRNDGSNPLENLDICLHFRSVQALDNLIDKLKFANYDKVNNEWGKDITYVSYSELIEALNNYYYGWTEYIYDSINCNINDYVLSDDNNKTNFSINT